MNCGNPTSGRYNYQGVIVCSHCFSLAKMCYARAEKQVKDLLTMFSESIRVQLASGRLRTTTSIPDKKSSVTDLKDPEILRNLITKLVSSKE